MKKNTLCLLAGGLMAFGALAAITPHAGKIFSDLGRKASALSPLEMAKDQAGPSKAPAAQVKAQNIPWSVDFAKANEADFTIIDANEDGIGWEFAGGEAQANYSPKDDMDDWLITPPLDLKGGYVYTLTFTAAANSPAYSEQLEVAIGHHPSVLAMEKVVLESFSITDMDYTTYTALVVPRLSGETYIGFHGVTPADHYKLRLKTMSVTAGTDEPNATTPAAVADLTVITTGNYDLNAKVFFTAPKTTKAGDALSEITEINVYRNGQTIKTIANPQPGQEISFADAVPAPGDYTYAVVTSNADGNGVAMEYKLRIGGVAPLYPEEVYLQELATPGHLRLSWTPVTEDVNGETIPEGFVRYIVLDTEMTLVADNLTDTSLEFSIPNGPQQFVQFIVAAQTVGGIGEGTMSNMRAIGPAMTSFSESFPNASLTSLMAVGYEFGFYEYVGWGIADDTTFADETGVSAVRAYDNDNGFAFMQTEYADTGASLLTGKITLAASGPGVSFAIFNQSLPSFPDKNLLEVLVSEDGDNWDVVSARTVYDWCGDKNGWNPVTVGLQKYAGKTVQIRWQVTTKSFSTFLIDAIKVISLPAHDLAIESITVPKEAATGEVVKASVNVINMGANHSEPFNVHLHADGVKVVTSQEAPLAPGERRTVEIPYQVSPVALDDITLHAELAYDKDLDAANNKSGSATVSPVQPKLPYVTTLSGNTREDGTVDLAWSQPIIVGFTPGKTESFESGEDFAHSFADWIFIDGDQLPIGGITPSIVPGLEPGETLASFMVFNENAPTFNEALQAHSGSKYIASLFAFENKMIDDWAITPELNGASQVISFWARSLEGYFPETMEIYYSFGSTDPKDFIHVSTVAQVPGEWTEYNIPVPTGAKRFAVRNHSEGAFALLLDDFHFADASQPIGVTIEKYNIFCDGIQVGSTEANTLAFSHDTAEQGNHKYAVTAQYQGLGNSRSSNTVELYVDRGLGVSSTTAPAAMNLNGNVLSVDGMAAEVLTIALADGKTFYQGLINDHFEIVLPAGLYIATCADQSFKIIVK